MPATYAGMFISCRFLLAEYPAPPDEPRFLKRAEVCKKPALSKRRQSLRIRQGFAKH